MFIPFTNYLSYSLNTYKSDDNSSSLLYYYLYHKVQESYGPLTHNYRLFSPSSELGSVWSYFLTSLLLFNRLHGLFLLNNSIFTGVYIYPRTFYFSISHKTIPPPLFDKPLDYNLVPSTSFL